MIQIFGHKTLALFDIWTIEHFISGANIGFFVSYLRSKMQLSSDRRTVIVLNICFLLIIELFWEIFEHYVELGLVIPSWQYWFQGPEHFLNRIISDPAITLLGLYFIIEFPRSRIFCSIFSCVWLFFHIVIFPHSMYLQDYIVKYFNL